LLLALLPIVTAPGYEADDVLGTLAQRGVRGIKSKFSPGDRDLFQLIDPQKEISVLYLSSALSSEAAPVPLSLDQSRLKRNWVLPSQVVDYKALWDKSDNIPRCEGNRRENSGGFAQYPTPLTIFMPR